MGDNVNSMFFNQFSEEAYMVPSICFNPASLPPIDFGRSKGFPFSFSISPFRAILPLSPQTPQRVVK